MTDGLDIYKYYDESILQIVVHCNISPIALAQIISECSASAISQHRRVHYTSLSVLSRLSNGAIRSHAMDK